MFILLKRRDLLLIFGIAVGFLLYIGVALLPTLPAFAPQSIDRATYVIDAGHGGEDGGAVSPLGVVESGINLEIAVRVNDLLRLCGEKTVMTRTADVSIHSEGAKTLHEKKASDLKNRAAIVNETENSVLVSIHQNSMPTAKSVHGAQVFYREGGEAAAKSVQLVLNQTVNDVPKCEKEISKSIYLMNHIESPAILIECGFLSNAEETEKLQQAEYQKKLAVTIVAGLLNEENEIAD